MFGFDVSVEGGVAKVALPAGAVEVATFVIFAGATFFGLFFNALFLFHVSRLSGTSCIAGADDTSNAI